MPTRTTAVLFDGAGSTPALEEITVRDPQAGEVLVRMTAAGVCHSDLHVINGDWPFDHRVALGHEGAGIVEAVGDADSDLAVGDQVILSWYAPCNRCTACAEGKSWLCSDSGAAVNGLPDGSTPLSADDGAPVRPYLGVSTFSQHSLVPRQALVKISADVPADIAALIGCSITTGIGAVLNTAEVRPGQTAVVIGAGGVGQAIIMGLKLASASRIIAIDLAEERLDIARSLGATHTILGDDPQLLERVLEMTGGAGADFAFDAIGHPATSAAMPGYLRAGGAAVLVGMPARTAEVPFKTWELVVTGKRIFGCNYGSSRPQVDFKKIAELYLSGLLPLDQMVGEHIPQASAIEAVEALRVPSGKRKIVNFSL